MNQDNIPAKIGKYDIVDVLGKGRSFLSLVMADVLRAQAGQPPWLDVADNDTLTLKWDFDGPAPLNPTVVVAPAWYNPAVTQLLPSAGIQVLGGVVAGVRKTA